MMKKSILFPFVFLLLTLFIPIESFPQSYQGGGTIIRVLENLPETKFNIKTDAVSLYLEKAVLYKHNGWFTSDKDIAITAKMSVNSQKRDRIASSLAISRIYRFDVSIYQEGKVEIPLKSLPLLDTYKLSGEDYVVTSIVLDIYLSKRKDKKPFSKVLETLIRVSQKIPVPGNPYAQYAPIFGDAFGEVIDNAIREDADTIPFARFGLRFLQGDKASYYTEKPGIHAVILGSDSNEEGVLKIDQIEGKKISYDDIRGLVCDGKKVGNNHLVIRATASIDPFAALLARDETIDRISALASSAVTLSLEKGLPSSNLQVIAELSKNGVITDPNIVDPNVLEGAIDELNSIGTYDLISRR
jgi:hypothetical protein